MDSFQMYALAPTSGLATATGLAALLAFLRLGRRLGARLSARLGFRAGGRRRRHILRPLGLLALGRHVPLVHVFDEVVVCSGCGVCL